MRVIFTSLALILFLNTNTSAAAVENYLYTSSGELEQLRPLLARPDIRGVQVVYTWKQLETAPGVYDFSPLPH